MYCISASTQNSFWQLDAYLRQIFLKTLPVQGQTGCRNKQWKRNILREQDEATGFNIYCSYCYIYIQWIALSSREYCLHSDVYRTLISCTVLQILPRFPVMFYYSSISMKLVPWLFLLEAKVLAFRLNSLQVVCHSNITILSTQNKSREKKKRISIKYQI